MGNHLKRTQPTPMYGCILGTACDDYRVWDGFNSDLSVGVGWNWLIVAMESLMGECNPRD